MIKLTSLLVTPLLVVVAIFAWGAYVGQVHRHDVLSFERDWLRMDIDVPEIQEPVAKDDPSDQTDVDREVSAAPVVQAPQHVLPSPSVPVSPSVTSALPNPATPTPDQAAQTPQPPIEASAPEPLPSDLAASFAMPFTLQLAVIVDDELVEGHHDWIDYVQSTVHQASAIYQTQFGIRLELIAVARRPTITEGSSTDERRADADVLVAMTQRPPDSSRPEHGELHRRGELSGGAEVVVYADPQHPAAPHLRTLLRELARQFGALDVTDSRAPAWQAGSWMSYAVVAEGRDRWIDPENRRRVLEHKGKLVMRDTSSPTSSNPRKQR